MYVLSAMVGDHAYLGYVYPPEVAYARFQREIVRVFERYPNIRLLLKPPIQGRYPTVANPLLDWLKGRTNANLELIEDARLDEVLDRADAFIIDSPSTPLLYLVATEKPFLAYWDRVVYRAVPEAAALLRKRAVYAETREEFFESLERFLQQEDWTLPKPVNDEFLVEYCTCATDGRSAERCAAFLHDCTKAQRPKGA